MALVDEEGWSSGDSNDGGWRDSGLNGGKLEG